MRDAKHSPSAPSNAHNSGHSNSSSRRTPTTLQIVKEKERERESERANPRGRERINIFILVASANANSICTKPFSLPPSTYSFGAALALGRRRLDARSAAQPFVSTRMFSHIGRRSIHLSDLPLHLLPRHCNIAKLNSTTLNSFNGRISKSPLRVPKALLYIPNTYSVQAHIAEHTKLTQIPQLETKPEPNIYQNSPSSAPKPALSFGHRTDSGLLISINLFVSVIDLKWQTLPLQQRRPRPMRLTQPSITSYRATQTLRPHLRTLPQPQPQPHLKC